MPTCHPILEPEIMIPWLSSNLTLGLGISPNISPARQLATVNILSRLAGAGSLR